MNEEGHKYRFSGVDMSGIKPVQEGQLKEINGVLYKYVRVKKRLVLFPVHELPQKRDNAGEKPEGKHANQRRKV